MAILLAASVSFWENSNGTVNATVLTQRSVRRRAQGRAAARARLRRAHALTSGPQGAAGSSHATGTCFCTTMQVEPQASAQSYTAGLSTPSQ